MEPEVVLFILRLVSAALLLLFLGVIGWFIYQDVQLATKAAPEGHRSYGSLRVIETGSSNLKAGSVFPLSPVMGIGRSASNTVVVEDDYVSGEHALLSLRGAQWWLEDLNSRNGTLLNDIPLDAPVVVAMGDILTIGNTRFKLELK
ncbi:MAG: FHA domain-containing protein [Candidatus Promineifilaceae bacterium]